MPAMPRVNGKATKIAWALLGKPLAMDKPHPSYKDSRREKQLVFEETTRVR